MERQAFGSKHYKMDIFCDVGPIFVSPDCKCDALAELIKLCRGKVTRNRSAAKIIIADRRRNHLTDTDNMISSNWVLDSISDGKLQKQQLYRLSIVEKQNAKENDKKCAKLVIEQ